MATPSQRKWLKRIAITLLTLLLVYTVVGFWGVPLIARFIVLPKINETLPGHGEVDAFYFNPYTYKLVVEGLSGYTPDGEEAVSFRELRVDFEFGSLFGECPRIEEIYLGDPVAILILDENGQLNISGGVEQLQEQMETQMEEQAESGEPFEIPLIEIKSLVVDNATLTGRIESLSRPFERNIRNLSFVMEDIRTSPERQNPYHFIAQTKAGEMIEVKGQIRLDPLSSDGTIQLSTVVLPDFFKLTNDQLGFDLTGGKLTFRADYAFRPVREPRELFIRDSSVLLEGFELTSIVDGKAFLSQERFAIEGLNIFLYQGAVEVDKVEMLNGSLRVTRDEEGVLNLIRYLLPEAEQAEVAERFADEQADEQALLDQFALGLIADQEDIGLAFASAWEQLQEVVGVTWDLKVGELDVQNQNLILVDEVPPRPVSLTLGEINLKVTNLANQSEDPFPFDLAMRMNEGGNVTAQGTFTAVPPSMSFDFDLQDFELAAFSPYLEATTPASLESARLSNRGTLKASFPDETLPAVEVDFRARVDAFKASVGSPLYAEAKPLSVTAQTITKSGKVEASFDEDGAADAQSQLNVAVENFSLARPELSPVQWQRLELASVSASTVPLQGSIETVTLTQLQVEVVRQQDGMINLFAYLPDAVTTTTPEADDAEAPAAAPSEPAFDQTAFTVKRFVMKDSAVKVRDVSVSPEAAFSLEQIEATAAPLRLTPDTLTELDTSMTLVGGGTGEIAVKGASRLLDPTSQSQATVTVKTVPMPDFSGFAVEAVGSPLTSGTFNGDFDYTIAEQQLKGKNKMKMTRMRFGQRVPDSDAPSLPLELGIAVLEDRSGVIDLDIPVSGDMSDPTFSFTNVIQGALENIIEKVVTSPFSLMGAAFGGGDAEAPPSEVIFAAGEATLSSSSAEPIKLIAQGVYERPALALELVPSIDPEKDAAALRQQLVQQAVEVEMAQGSDEEDALEDLFDVAFPDGLPANADGSEPELTPLLMREKLEEKQAVPAVAFVQLAQDRADAVRNAIITDQTLDASRVRTAAPEGGYAEDGAKVTFQLGVAQEQ
ncbi:MAG: DUF748 domain-containing protein [Verrucomicrobiota bacterium]